MHKLVLTSDGSHTIYVPELDEHYHSVHGAIQESGHIFIENGFKSVSASLSDILEIGFGTGLNALLTLLACKGTGSVVNYTTIEKYPLKAEMTENLNYGTLISEDASRLLREIHSCRWNEFVQLTDNFNLRKVEGDLITMEVNGHYNMVYFDAFGPDKQPEMWSGNVFSKISRVTRKGGVFVTYSAKGQVKRNLRENGFEVKLLPGPPGKRQMIRAVKN